jgi:hypothetical protein
MYIHTVADWTKEKESHCMMAIWNMDSGGKRRELEKESCSLCQGEKDGVQKLSKNTEMREWKNDLLFRKLLVLMSNEHKRK